MLPKVKGIILSFIHQIHQIFLVQEQEGRSRVEILMFPLKN